MNKFIDFDDLYGLIIDIFNGGGMFKFAPSGQSMLPTICGKKDEVILKRPDIIEKRDIVFYRRKNGVLVMHRIVGKDKDGYVMRGDNQYFNEHGITDDMIFAVVTQINRADGKIIKKGEKEYYLPFMVNFRGQVIHALLRIKGIFVK